MRIRIGSRLLLAEPVELDDGVQTVRDLGYSFFGFQSFKESLVVHFFRRLSLPFKRLEKHDEVNADDEGDTYS